MWQLGLSYQCMTGGSRGALQADMPSKPCSGGIFTTHHFPPSVQQCHTNFHKEAILTWHRCWDGKNLDSPDHQSHMYNTVNTDYFNNAPVSSL